MTLATGNLFGPGSPEVPADETSMGDVPELVEALVEQRDVTIERIVSMGHASPPGFWYDCPREEWVVLVSGAAALEFDGQVALHEMRPGDHVKIPAHCRHRVASTHASEPTVWLAVYYPAS